MNTIEMYRRAKKMGVDLLTLEINEAETDDGHPIFTVDAGEYEANMNEGDESESWKANDAADWQRCSSVVSDPIARSIIRDCVFRHIAKNCIDWDEFLMSGL